jgi:2-aminoadipate transaminase
MIAGHEDTAPRDVPMGGGQQRGVAPGICAAAGMMKSALSELGRRTEAPPVSWLMELALNRPRLISLAAGFTDHRTLPVSEARRLLARLLATRRTGEPALQYGSTDGLPELRRLTVERLGSLEGASGADGTLFTPDRMIITHGSQQFLYLVTEVLCDRGDVVLVEDPTYFVYLGILQSHGLACRGLRLEPDGLDLAHLESVLAELKRSGRLPRLKLVYLVTYHQNPTGTTTAFAKKVAALALLRRYEKAAGHPVYLLEDAAYRELGFHRAAPPSALGARGFSERVIYTSTFSKPFATGARVGFGWLPRALRDAVMRVKGNHDFGTANLLQHLLARALASGEYDAHLATLRRRYAQKAAWMTSALRTHLPESVQWREPRGGMYVWAALPRGTGTGLSSRCFGRALENDVLYVPGALCYARDPSRRRPDHEMRLSFGNASRRDILEGIRRLGEVLRGL